MILVRNRGAEEGHSPIPHDLIDGAFIAMHRRHQALQHRVEELPRLFRVAVGQEFHEAFEIGEEHHDLLALAFEGAVGDEDLLGEVRGGVGLGGLGRGASDGGVASVVVPVREVPQ
jgi:hypothetical protein